MIELYSDKKRGDKAIVTNCSDERAFMEQFRDLLSDVAEKNTYKGKWDEYLNDWLQQMVDICCKYRGYKNTVREEKRLIAGGPIIGGDPVHVIEKSKHDGRILKNVKKIVRGEILDEPGKAAS